ncbi:MAG: hypothetical protein V3W44_09700 [Dehalococcoidales bacterium]
MKFQVQLSERDVWCGLGETVADAMAKIEGLSPGEAEAVSDMRQNAMTHFVCSWISHGVIAIEFDSEAETATVIKQRT